MQNTKVHVSIETTGIDSMDPRKLIEKLMLVLEAKSPVDIEIETPPETPPPTEDKPGALQPAVNIKLEEPRPVPPKTCRNCERQVEQAAIQETMSRLGLTPPDEVSRYCTALHIANL